MRSKPTIPFNIIAGFIMTAVISESLALLDSSAPSVSFLSSPPSSNAGSTLPSQIPTYNPATIFSSSQFSTSNFATGSSVPEPIFFNTASEYSNINVETGSLASQTATTNSAPGSSALESVSTNSATGTSASQFAAINSATGTSTSQFINNGLSTRSSTSVAAQNNIQNPVIPVSIVKQFASSISQDIVSLEILKNFFDFELKNSHDLFLNYDHNILSSAGIQLPYLEELISNTVKSLGVLSSPVYFTAIANTLAKFLLSKGVLTNETAASLSQKFFDLVDSHGRTNGVNSSESLIISVADGLFELVFSLGLLNTNEDFEQLFHLFAGELKAGSH